MSFCFRSITTLAILAIRLGALSAKLILALFVTHYLGLADLGTYGLVVAAAQIAPMIIGLSMAGLLTRTHGSGPELELLGPMIRIWARFGALYGLAAVLALALPMAGTMSISVIVGIVALEHLNQDLFAIVMAKQRPVLATILFALRTALWIFAFVGFGTILPETVSLASLLLFWLFGLLVPVVVFFVAMRDWPWKAAIQLARRPAPLISVVKSAGPIFVSDLAYNASLYADRIILALFAPLDQVGLYVFCWQIANATHNLMLTSSMGIARPRLIELWSQGEMDAYRGVRRQTANSSLALACMLSIGAAGSVIALDMVGVLPTLHGAWPLLGAMLVLNIARASTELAGQVLFTTQSDLALAVSSVLMLGTVLSMFVAGLWLYPGVEPPVFATAVALLLVLVCRLRSFPEQARA